MIARLGQPLPGHGHADIIVICWKRYLYALYPALGVGSLGAEGYSRIGNSRCGQALAGPSLRPMVVVAGTLPARALVGSELREHGGEDGGILGAGHLLHEVRVP